MRKEKREGEMLWSVGASDKGLKPALELLDSCARRHVTKEVEAHNLAC
jgi:hypothetical protein